MYESTDMNQRNFLCHLMIFIKKNYVNINAEENIYLQSLILFNKRVDMFIVNIVYLFIYKSSKNDIVYKNSGSLLFILRFYSSN